MALGGDGLMAQAVSLTQRECGWQEGRVERRTPSSWGLVLGTGMVLHPASFSSHGSSGHQVGGVSGLGDGHRQRGSFIPSTSQWCVGVPTPRDLALSSPANSCS